MSFFANAFFPNAFEKKLKIIHNYVERRGWKRPK